MSEVKKIKINGTDIAIKDETARTGITENSKAIAAEAEARKNADTNYTGDNRTSTVEGDDTRTAGDITDTADNIVIHAKASILMDSDGSYTEDIEGKKKIDADSIEETYQKTRSIHVVGAQTEAVDSSATKSIDGTYSKIVTGAVTETYKDSLNVTAKNSTETVTEKKTIKAADIALDPTSGALTYSEPVKNNKLVTVPMKSTTGVLYNLLCEGSEVGGNRGIKTVKDYGAYGDGIHDDTAAIQAALDSNNIIFIPDGDYLLSGTLHCDDTAIYGGGSHSNLIMSAGHKDTILAIGGVCPIQNLQFMYRDDVSNCGPDVYTAVLTMGSMYPLQRTSMRDLVFYNVGTAIADDVNNPTFSIHYDSIRIDRFGYSAIHQRSVGSSGNHYDNILITTPLSDYNLIGIRMERWCNNHVFTNINIEWGKYGTGMLIQDASNIVINSLTVERAFWPEIQGFIKLGCNAQIENISFIYNQFETAPNTKCLIELLGAFHTTNQYEQNGPFPYRINIGSLNIIGLNHENGGIKDKDIYIFGKYDRNATKFTVDVKNLYYLSYNDDWDVLKTRYVFQYVLDSIVMLSRGNAPTFGPALPDTNLYGDFTFYLKTEDGVYHNFRGSWYKVTN